HRPKSPEDTTRFDGYYDAYNATFAEVVTSPFQLSVEDSIRNHMGHHAYEGKENDPDLYLVQGPSITALLNALSEPEQAMIRRFWRKKSIPPLVTFVAKSAELYAWFSFGGFSLLFLYLSIS